MEEDAQKPPGNKSTCDRCGREALGQIGDETLCENCYHGASACCSDSISDD